MKKLFILTFILFIIFSNLSYASFCTGTQPPSSGDWLIEDNTECNCGAQSSYCKSMADIYVNESIIVKGNGNLTIENCLVYVNGRQHSTGQGPPFNEEYRAIVVNDSGSLTLDGCALRFPMTLHNIVVKGKSSLNLIDNEWCGSPNEIILGGESKNYLYKLKNNFGSDTIFEIFLYGNSRTLIENSTTMWVNVGFSGYGGAVEYGWGGSATLKNSVAYCWGGTFSNIDFIDSQLTPNVEDFFFPEIMGTNTKANVFVPPYSCFPTDLPFSIREGSCSGEEKCSTYKYSSCSFNTPSIPGNYKYYACADKDKDGNFNDEGEYVSKEMKVINLNEGEFTYCSELNETGKTYRLVNDISDITHEHPCIKLSAGDIVLDCQGHKIDGSPYVRDIGSGWISKTVDGIQAYNRKNITIKNCALENFNYGIFLSSVNESLIQNIHLKNTFLRAIGIISSFKNNIINLTSIDSNWNDIWLRSSFNNTIDNAKCYCTKNSGCPISIGLPYSSFNVIKNSKLNSFAVIDIEASKSNKIYNNLFNVTRFWLEGPVYFKSYEQNYWNSTEGGNYWTNFNKSGFSNTCSDNNGDRICDDPCTLASNNIDFMPLKYIPDDYSSSGQITLQSGWNMLSLPFSTDANIIKTQCGTTNNIWHYNPSTARYVSVNTIYPGYGYWLRLDSSCVISYSSITENYPDLKAGWNQIGAFTSTSFSSVKGDCNVLAGPWKYNPSTSRYELSSTLEPGYGYWIRVSNDCSLGI